MPNGGLNYSKKNPGFVRPNRKTNYLLYKWSKYNWRHQFYKLDDRFLYGKYRGIVVRDVLHHYPRYIDYCIYNNIFTIIDDNGKKLNSA